MSTETAERPLAEEALRAERDRARAVLENMGEGFLLLGRDFVILDISAEGLRIDGRPREAIVGRRLLEVWPESADMPTWPAYVQAMKSREPATVSYRHVSATHDVALQVRVFPHPEGLAVFYKDVTAQQQAEASLRSSEAFNRSVLHSSSDCIKVLDLDGRLEFMSDGGMCLMEIEDFGVAKGASWQEFWPDAGRDKALAAMAAARNGEVGRFEGFARTFKGSPRWWDVIVTPINGPDGRPHKLLSVSRDVTSILETQAALRDTTRRLDAILNNTRMAVFLMDERQQCVFANAAAEALTGYAFAQMQGRPLHDVVHHKRPDGSPYPLEECPIDRAFPERAQMQGEELFVAPDGSFYPVAFTASPVLDDAGRPVGTVIEARNIAERKARDAVILESEARFRNMADHAPVMMWVTDPSGACLYLNRAWYEFTGQTEAEAAGFGWLEVTHPDDKAEAERVFREANERREPFRLEYRLRRADGRHRWAIDAAAPRFGEGGEFLGYIGSVIDIDDRREAEEALRRANDLLAAVMEAVPGVVYAKDRDGRMLAANRGTVELVGKPMEAILGRTDREFLDDPAQAEAVMANDQRVMAENRTEVLEEEVSLPDGTRATWLSTKAPFRDPAGAVVGLVGSSLDISDRKRAEEQLQQLNDTLEEQVAERTAERDRTQEQLRQAQKMEAVGQLTGGVAHDFNNLLTIVSGNIDMAGRALDRAGVDDPRARRALENAMKGAERAAALTQRLLAFSRRQPLAPKPLDVDKLVAGMSDLLNRTLGETVRLEVVTSPGLWRVEADPNQLEAAVLNLALNARDAMPGGGWLTVETANARLDEAYAARNPDAAPGQYVVIAVTDTGQGIPRETLDRVFEPFFTTKEVGKGTGLGLSMVYGFVKQSGGHVKMYSEEGRGTTVKIYLPRLLTEPQAEDEAQAAPDLEVGGDQETVLVAEDDDDVRAYTVDCLRELGYRVLEAHDGASALRLLERQDRPVDLLFTDVVMPGMSGDVLAEAARARLPGLKVLFTSGYTRNIIVQGGRLDPGVEIVAKPFTYATLARRIRSVLD